MHTNLNFDIPNNNTPNANTPYTSTPNITNTSRSNEQAIWLMFRLHTMRGIGNKSIQRMIQYLENKHTCGTLLQTPEVLLQRLFQMTEQELEQILAIRERNAFQAGRTEYNRQQAERAYYEMQQKQIDFYPIFHEQYPPELLQIADPPYALYVKGQLPQPKRRKIGVIGARICSEYGRHMAREFGYGLAKNGIDIVSGLALGVDGISQKAALEAGGNTYAILGSGVDVCYPEENLTIYDAIAEKGGILSEYPPGTLPKTGHFPMRNRIISGLSQAVLVIEARKKSGTLITADLALEQGKEVFAVPGRATDHLSDGCNALLLQGAGLAISPEQLVQELWGRQDTLELLQPEHQARSQAEKQEKDQTKEQIENQPETAESQENVVIKRILDVVDITPKTIDQIFVEIMRKSDKIAAEEEPQILIQDVSRALVMLSIRQIVHQIDGNYFYRTEI